MPEWSLWVVVMKLVKKEIKRKKLNRLDAIRTEIVQYNYRDARTVNHKVYIFKCEGQNCNEELRIQHNQLRNHSVLCRSCVQKGVPFQAPYNEMITTVHRTGKKDISITYEDFLVFTKINACHYCYTPIVWIPHTKTKGKEVRGSRSYKLDRKDNNIGYHMYNVVVCCWKCNQAKGNRYTYEEWYGMTEYLRKKVPKKILEQITEVDKIVQAHIRQLQAYEGWDDYVY